MATPKEVYVKAVKARINGDKNHGWGIDDSFAVIKALAEDWAGSALGDEYEKWIRKPINPSAQRQELEDAGQLTPKPKKISAEMADLFKE